MDTDLLFVVGLGLGVLAIPSMVSAFVDGRAPRVPAYLIILGGLMIGYAVQQRPSAYGFDTVPEVMMRVVARYLN